MVIPVGDNNPTRRTAWVTLALVAANVTIFVLFEPWSAGRCVQESFFLQWATVPRELAQGAPLGAAEVASATNCPIQPFPAKNVYFTALSSLFLHASWIHLLGNMLYLWVFGNNIEDVFGPLRFLGFYLLAGLVATAVFTMANLGSLSTLVGASGAIAGVLGAYLVLFPRARITSLVPFLLFLPIKLPALIVLGLWFVLQLNQVTQATSMAGGGVAYLAHVAGFVFGVLVTLSVRGSRVQRPRW
ncbi:MAG: rhomboid family intramembrane serine protease [Egibacteraceae bacterium]